MSTRVLILLTCVSLAACSRASTGEDARANLRSPEPAQASPTSSPTPPPAQLNVPERVASGAVTETGGVWDRRVQRIMYPSSADNTRQSMMFYKTNH